MLQTGSWHFPFFFLFTLHLCPIMAYFLKDCTIDYSDNVTAGVSVQCGNGFLVSVPEDIPRDVISLSLAVNKIQKINRSDFYHLSNVTDLDLSSNLITHVEGRAFVPLVQLKVLNMDYNQLTTLTDNMFQGLSNLLILSLADNIITFINPAAFQSLASLQEFTLASNQLTVIIHVLQLPSLQVLDIAIYELESFQSKDLPLNMSSELRKLSVSSKSIKRFSITTAVFPNLKTIDLAYCCNDTGWEWDVPDKYFLRNITHLVYSIRSFNNIRKALQSLDSLEYLHVSYMLDVRIDRDFIHIVCKIATLRKLNLHACINANLIETLPLCTQLTNLDLSFNDIAELSKDSIKQMHQLSRLSLAFNHLSKVPDDVKNLSMLQILNLRSNHILDLSCSDFLNLTSLTHLHIDYNYISELKQCVFQHLHELKVLTLNNNFIETFGDMFKTGLHKLELLDLDDNNIGQPSKGEFNGLKSLKKLDLELSGNSILPLLWENNYLEGLDELETLKLNIDWTFSQWQNDSTLLMKSLKSLTIECSSVVNIPFFITSDNDMKHLEHLNVVGFLKMSDSLKYLPQLKTLSMRSSHLTSLDFLAQANLTQLSWLDLTFNDLTVINVSVFSFLPALRFIYMADNPLACDCSNADFQQWMQNNNQTHVNGAYRYTCAYPLAKKGTRFLDFDYHSCFVDNSFICYISSTCVIVLTLLTSFTYHFLRLHLLYAYYLFLAFLYDAKRRKRGSPQRYDAFISYNVHDELWVVREMLPVLEGEQGWRLCLHHRDFLPGKPIVENIADAIYGSRKTICVISHHYLESEWCSREIQMARWGSIADVMAPYSGSS